MEEFRDGERAIFVKLYQNYAHLVGSPATILFVW